MSQSTWAPEDITNIVSRLTLEQKVAQVTGLTAPELFVLGAGGTAPAIDTGRLVELRPHGVGHLSLGWFLGHGSASLREELEEVQAAVREISPFGIGALVHVVGPAADELRVHFGAYTSVAEREMPLGMRVVRTGQVPGVDPASFVFTDIFQTRMPGFDPVFEDEARKLHPETPTLLQALRSFDAEIGFEPLGRFETDPGHRLDAARVEAAVGERTGWAGNNTVGEGQTTAEPKLPGDQEQLIELLAATGKPLVTVLVSGRPLLLEPVARASNAILLAPLLGEEAGPAIAAALFGRINPSGKLPSTFPRHGYNDLDVQGPLYAFGHGLSYTTFDVVLEEAEYAEGTVRARLNVTNTGPVDGETVVQAVRTRRASHRGAPRPAAAVVRTTRPHRRCDPRTRARGPRRAALLHPHRREPRPGGGRGDGADRPQQRRPWARSDDRGPGFPREGEVTSGAGRDIAAYRPGPDRADAYDELYALFIRLHHQFADGAVMHRLREIRNTASAVTKKENPVL